MDYHHYSPVLAIIVSDSPKEKLQSYGWVSLSLYCSSRNELHSNAKEVYGIIIVVLLNGRKRNSIIEKYVLP